MTTVHDDLQAVRTVGDAVLFEGYLLYPYRASSSKNQVRWQFGVLGPVGAAAAGVGEEPSIFTECLVQGFDANVDVNVDVHLRFLQTQWRSVERAMLDGTFIPVDELLVAGARWIAWHEAVEQELVLRECSLVTPDTGRETHLAVAGGEEVEFLRDDTGRVVGRLVRTRWPLTARITMRMRAVPENANRISILRVEVVNETPWVLDTEAVKGASARDLAARGSFVGTHLILQVRNGDFVSTVDPPDWAAVAAKACANSRCWPVLAGTYDGVGSQTSDVILASPIILYDHPVIAEESPGQLYDSTEIDEILTLRIMTMTEDEKLAARGTDPRAADIIDRCDDMPPEVFERLHGALRGYDLDGFDSITPDFPTLYTPTPHPLLVDPESANFDTNGAPWWDPAEDASVSPDTDAVLVDGIRVAKGSKVMLRPNRRADAHDLFLAGMSATVHAVLADVDGGSHVAVTIDDDPAAELHDWYGRYHYFAPDELEPIVSSVSMGTEFS